MPEYCLHCDYEEELELSRKPVTITVRGEEFEVTKEFYQCPVCGGAFTSSFDHDPLDEAYRNYRKRHQLLQPEEIRQWRQNAGLTLTEVSELLGWETTTLRSYEAGALQAEEHDKQLNLLLLVESQWKVWSEERRNVLILHIDSDSGVQSASCVS